MNSILIDHFKLKRLPFSSEIDSVSMLKFGSFHQGELRLESALQQRGMALILGESGAGKSTLVRSLQQRLGSSSYRLLYSAAPALDSAIKPVIEDLLGQLGEQVPFRNPSKGIKLLQDSLRRTEQQGQLPVIVIDDAHSFDAPSWLLLKTLTNYEIDSKLPFCLWLIGARSDITKMLSLNRMAEIRGRLHFCFHLRGLECEETEAYVKAHLSWAGTDRPLFPRDVCLDLHRRSKGLPRSVNRLAYGAMMAAACDRKELVDLLCLEHAASELLLPSQN